MLAVLIMVLAMFPLVATSGIMTVKVDFCEEICEILDTIKSVIPTNEVGEILETMF